jgi:hypothetical protein
MDQVRNIAEYDGDAAQVFVVGKSVLDKLVRVHHAVHPRACGSEN